MGNTAKHPIAPGLTFAPCAVSGPDFHSISLRLLLDSKKKKYKLSVYLAK